MNVSPSSKLKEASLWEPAVDTNAEITRLKDLMPASGRMNVRLLLDPRQPTLIKALFPRPWKQSHPITLNPTLWQDLTLPQRDLIFLQAVCWLTSVQLVKPELYQGAAVAGAIATLVELVQGDVVGLLAAGGLTAIATTQIWRTSTGTQALIAADRAALNVAKRRGYTEAEAAHHLLKALEAIATLEGQGGLSYVDLLRVQNLRPLASASKGAAVPPA